MINFASPRRFFANPHSLIRKASVFQTAALTGRAREFLKEQRVLKPAEFRIARIVCRTVLKSVLTQLWCNPDCV
jgi:hypothetical protein